MYYLFVYGLMRSCNQSYQAKKVKSFTDLIIRATLPKYSLFINLNGLVPTIYNTNDSDDYVDGELYCCFDIIMFDSLIKQLDAYVGDKFKKTSIIINNGQSDVNAFTYISTDLDDFNYCEYHDYYDYLKKEHNLVLQNQK